MNRISLLFLTAGLLQNAPAAHARVWRVNNNPGIDANFTSAQAAHDATTTLAGDTLHIEASQGSYGSLTMSKRLVLIGPGYFLNQNPNQQADPRPAVFDVVDLHIGATGSQLMGLTISNALTISAASNVLIQRNQIEVFRLDPNGISFGNVIILQNYVSRLFPYQGGGLVSGIQISNNYFNNELNLSSIFSGTMTNNIFNMSNSVDVSGFVVRNNILVGSGSFVPNNNTYDHNMGAGFGTANGNVTFPGTAAVFVTTGSPDARWQLKAGTNPARGTGAGGVDMGLYGGPTPYRLSGIPAVPSITNLTVPASGGSGAPLNVTISVQANN